MPTPTRPKRVKHPEFADFAPMPITEVAADQAFPVDEDNWFLITKGSPLAGTLAAPGAGNIGRRLRFSSGSDFAHVITATGATVRDGTTGGHATLTSPAFEGGTLTLVAISATKWNVESNNLWVIT
jgi:hypothetical protein